MQFNFQNLFEANWGIRNKASLFINFQRVRGDTGIVRCQYSNCACTLLRYLNSSSDWNAISFIGVNGFACFKNITTRFEAPATSVPRPVPMITQSQNGSLSETWMPFPSQMLLDCVQCGSSDCVFNSQPRTIGPLLIYSRYANIVFCLLRDNLVRLMCVPSTCLRRD